MNGLTDEMRAEMRAITANLGHSRRCSSATRHFRHDGKEVVEVTGPTAIVNHSMFPYRSSAMAVDPSEVPEVQERLRKQGIFAEFDSTGRPIVESSKQQDALAKALGMKTGRDGYGHVDEYGQFQNSGRRRTEEMEAGRAKVRRVIQELETMPETVPSGAVSDLLDQYDICPTEENTG